MIDDDISEFAEALQAACDEHIAKGGIIVPFTPLSARASECNCPLGALLGKKYPSAGAALDQICQNHIAKSQFYYSNIREFILGFDKGYLAGGKGPLFELGIQFRNQYYF